jgi:hypothetical protein
VRGGKRDRAVMSGSCRTKSSQGSYLIISRHADIQVKSLAESKTALGRRESKIKSIPELRLKAIAVQFDFFGECFFYDFPLVVIEDFLIRSAIGSIFRFGCDAKRSVKGDV